MEKAKSRIVVVLLSLVAVGTGAFVGIHAWRNHARRMAEVAERRAMLHELGIESDGTQDFVQLPRVAPHNAARAALGQTLFTDRRLAKSRRRVCAACHWLNEGGTDGKLHGGTLTRPLSDAAFNSVFMHDGSVRDLRDVVARMVEGDDFCGGGPVSNVVERLKADAGLVARFQTVCDDGPDRGLSVSNALDCVAQFCRSRVSPLSPLDGFCGGNTNALDAVQKAGMELFRGKCLSCHDGPVLGGRRVSEGRKVPPLRGISRRRVYMSGGACADLGAVLSLMPAGEMEAEERAAIVAFLKAL